VAGLAASGQVDDGPEPARGAASGSRARRLPWRGERNAHSRFPVRLVGAVSAARNGATITFARGAIVLPEPLASIALALRHQRISSGALDGWLLPGRKPGTHITAEHLRKRLAPYGVASRPGRHGALLALAGRLPAPILAERLVHQARAAQWVRAAGATYSGYVELRLARDVGDVP
jgi:hypothetical protein